MKLDCGPAEPTVMRAMKQNLAAQLLVVAQRLGVEWVTRTLARVLAGRGHGPSRTEWSRTSARADSASLGEAWRVEFSLRLAGPPGPGRRAGSW